MPRVAPRNCLQGSLPDIKKGIHRADFFGLKNLYLSKFSTSVFFFLAAVNGLFIGPIQSASRVVITNMLNKNNQGKGFGLFATSGKLTSFLGPLLVSTVTFLTDSQRIGFSAAIILLLAGLIILLNIKKIN